MNKWGMGIVFSVIMVIVLLFMLPLISSLSTNSSIAALKDKLEQWGVYGYSIGALTDTRVPFVSAGNLADDANFTYTSATDTLGVTTVDATTVGATTANVTTLNADKTPSDGDVINTVYLMGASYFERSDGPAPQLRKDLGYYYDIINQGISGQTSAQVLARFATDATDYGNCNYIIIHSGLNDLFGAVPVATVEANLAAMYLAGHNAGAKVVAVTLPPCKNYVGWTAGIQADEDAINSWIVAGPTNVDYVVDIYDLLEDPAGTDTLAAGYDSGDGLHLNAAGNIAFADHIYSEVTWATSTTAPVTSNEHITAGSFYSPDRLRLGTDRLNIGWRSNYANTTGVNNISLGAYSLYSNTTGYSNIAIGEKSLYTGTGCYQSIAIGQNSLLSTTGYNNVAVGHNTLAGAGSGYSNVALGYNTMAANTDGYQNVAVGSSALDTNTTGIGNTALGYYSLTSNTTGAYNTSIGHSSMVTAGTGANQNVAIGYYSLYTNSTGDNNIALGAFAGRYETGSNAFYVNNTNRTSTELDKTNSLLYGTMSATNTPAGMASQTLAINAGTITTGQNANIKTAIVTVDHASHGALNAAGTTDNALLWQQPAGSTLLAVKLVLTEQFVAAGLTDMDFTLGENGGDVDGWLAPTGNGVSDAVATAYKTRGALWDTAAEGSFFYQNSATDIYIYVTATGANLNTLTTGTWTAYITYIDN